MGRGEIMESEGSKRLDERLREAAAALRWESFEELARRGAALRPKNGGPSPLSEAALAMDEESSPRAIEELLRLGARLEGEDKPSLSAQVVATRAPMSAIRALARGGAWEKAAKSSQTLIALAHGEWIEDADAAERIAEIAGGGGEVEALGEQGKTALMLACLRGRLHCVKALLAAGASPDAKDANGATALMWVVIIRPEAATDLAEALLRAGANPNEPDLKGLSPRELARLKSLSRSDGGLFGLFTAIEEREGLESSVASPGLISKGPAL